MAVHCFGEKLRALRKARGWNQKELARRYGGFKRSEVSNLERGVRQPTVPFLAWLREQFDVTFDHLLDDSEPLPPTALGIDPNEPAT